MACTMGATLHASEKNPGESFILMHLRDPKVTGLRGYLTKLLRGEAHAQRASSTWQGSEIAAAMSRKRRVWSRPLRLTGWTRAPSL